MKRLLHHFRLYRAIRRIYRRARWERVARAHAGGEVWSLG